MKFSNFKYLVKQGFLNFKENKLMSVASVGVVCSCLIIVGVFGLLALNVNRFVSYLGDQNEVVVYIREEADQGQIDAIDSFIKGEENISAYDFVSKEEGLKEQMSYLQEYANLLESYLGDANPIPPSFRCHIRDLKRIEETAQSLSQLEGVEQVTTPIELAGVLVTLKNATYYSGISVLAILVFVSIVVISNTIRLTVFARRKEINIMKFVGATNSFIRLPFIVEGVIIGTISALVTFSILSGGYIYLMNYLSQNTNGWIQMVTMCFVQYVDIWYIMLPIFLLFGWFIGTVGSAVSMKRYLKV